MNGPSVRAFFHEGKGTSYSGHWSGDSALLPAVPIDSKADKSG